MLSFFLYSYFFPNKKFEKKTMLGFVQGEKIFRKISFLEVLHQNPNIKLSDYLMSNEVNDSFYRIQSSRSLL